MRECIPRRPELRESCKLLGFEIVGELMEHNFLVRDKLKGWIKQLEHEISQRPQSKHVPHLYAFGRVAEQYLQALAPFARALEHIVRRGGQGDGDDEPDSAGPKRSADERDGSKDTAKFFHDELSSCSTMAAELTTIEADVRTMLNTAKELSTLYRTIQEEQSNRVLQLLTVVTTSVLPAQFMSGLYGMNFDAMPELHWRWKMGGVGFSGYTIWWVIVVTSVGLIVNWFRKNT